MNVQSMTGFARVDGGHEVWRWTWELRSVNGKALDLRSRLPSGFEEIEPRLRDILCTHVSRGNIQAGLQIEGGEPAALPVLDERAFAAAREAVNRASQLAGLPPADIASVLAIRGVIDYREAPGDPDAAEARNAALLESFDAACEALAGVRQREGAAIASVLSSQIDEIETLTALVAADPSRTVSAIRERLATQVARLMETGSSLDEQRLHQEAALLATKADLQEEVDRLNAHVAAARRLLAEGGAVGRKLDFLSQEFNRECNTVCSKSNAVAVTALGLEMKVVIDRFREQVQNVQ